MFTRWLGAFLGVLLIADGIAETVRLTRSGDGGFLFWFGTLVGGGVLILAGTVLRARSSRAGWPLLVAGCILGIPATLWTIVFPLLLIALAIMTGPRGGGRARPARRLDLSGAAYSWLSSTSSNSTTAPSASAGPSASSP